MIKIVFCKIYQLFKFLDVDSIPQYSAIGILSIFLTFNAIAVYSYSRYLFGYRGKYSFPLPLVVIFFLAFMGICYLTLVKDDNYIKIYKGFHKSGMDAGSGPLLLTLGYILVSLGAMIGLIWVH